MCFLEEKERESMHVRNLIKMYKEERKIARHILYPNACIHLFISSRHVMWNFFLPDEHRAGKGLGVPACACNSQQHVLKSDLLFAGFQDQVFRGRFHAGEWLGIGSLCHGRKYCHPHHHKVPPVSHVWNEELKCDHLQHPSAAALGKRRNHREGKGIRRYVTTGEWALCFHYGSD